MTVVWHQWMHETHWMFYWATTCHIERDGWIQRRATQSARRIFGTMTTTIFTKPLIGWKIVISSFTFCNMIIRKFRGFLYFKLCHECIRSNLNFAINLRYEGNRISEMVPGWGRDIPKLESLYNLMYFEADWDPDKIYSTSPTNNIFTLNKSTRQCSLYYFLLLLCEIIKTFCRNSASHTKKELII